MEESEQDVISWTLIKHSFITVTLVIALRIFMSLRTLPRESQVAPWHPGLYLAWGSTSFDHGASESSESETLSFK